MDGNVVPLVLSGLGFIFGCTMAWSGIKEILKEIENSRASARRMRTHK